MAHLAHPHQIIQRTHDLFGRRQPVPDVHQVEIDIVGAQPLQRSIHRPHDVLAAVAAGIRIARLHVHGELAGDHRSVAQTPLGDEFA